MDATPEPRFAATLALRSLPRFTPAEFLGALNKLMAPSGASAELVTELTRVEAQRGRGRVWQRPELPPCIGVSLAGIVLVIEGHDRPGFDGPRLAALDLGDWAEGARTLARSHAHLRIFEADPQLGAEFDHNHDRAAAVTAAAAAAATLVTAAGAVWESSDVAFPATELGRAVPALVQGRPPVGIWIAARARAGGVVTTRGLYPLLGAEVEVRASGLGLEAARRAALAMADDIVGEGRPPAEGEEIDIGAGRLRLGVRYGTTGAESGSGGTPAVILEERMAALPAPAGLAVSMPGGADLAVGVA